MRLDSLASIPSSQRDFELLDCMADNPGKSERTNHDPWVGHNLECVADHMTNTWERVIFAVKGRAQEIFGVQLDIVDKK